MHPFFFLLIGLFSVDISVPDSDLSENALVLTAQRVNETTFFVSRLLANFSRSHELWKSGLVHLGRDTQYPNKAA